MLSILGFYFYVILSIVSGETPSESNSFIATYILIFFADIILFSTVSACISVYFAHYIIKNNLTKTGLYKFISKVIEL